MNRTVLVALLLLSKLSLAASELKGTALVAEPDLTITARAKAGAAIFSNSEVTSAFGLGGDLSAGITPSFAVNLSFLRSNGSVKFPPPAQGLPGSSQSLTNTSISISPAYQLRKNRVALEVGPTIGVLLQNAVARVEGAPDDTNSTSFLSAGVKASLDIRIVAGLIVSVVPEFSQAITNGANFSTASISGGFGYQF